VASGLSCGESETARVERARTGGDRFFAFIKASDFEGAYRDALSKSYRGEVSRDAFIAYRQSLERSFGRLRDYTVVGSEVKPEIGKLRLNYAVRCGDRQQPNYEILEMVEENGEWRVAGLEIVTSGEQRPAGRD
jgi:hypothetical protein